MNGSIRGSLVYHLLASLPLFTFAVLYLATKLARISRVPVPWRVLTLGLLTFLSLFAVGYLFQPLFLDDAESAVAGAAIQAMRGLPVYPDASAAAHYGLVYGPMASLWHVPFYSVFGKNLFAFKLAGVLAFLLSLIGLYRMCRKYADPRASLLGLGFAAVLLLQYFGYDFWGRSDPLILLMLVASLLAAIDGPDWAALLMAALTIGILVNLKISAGAYVLPLVGFLFFRRGWKITLGASAGGALFTLLPFALPQVSLTNYLFLINVVKNQGLSFDFLSRNIQYSLILLVPLAFLARRGANPSSSAQRAYFGLIACGMAATCIVGSKIGAGNYHLYPYLAPILHLYFWRRSELAAPDRDAAVPRFAIPFVATLAFYSIVHVANYLHAYEYGAMGSAALSEIRSVERRYAGRTVQAGVGDQADDARNSYGPISAFDGQPYTINLQSVRDTQSGGVDLPEATIQDIRDCGTAVWLIPKNQAPFGATNAYYTSQHPAFSDTFRNTFTEHYSKIDSLTAFDVWMCRTAHP